MQTATPAATKPSTRCVEIDALRGLLLLIMMANHLVLWPLQMLKPALEHLYQPFGFVSAAEGFFFLSGLVSAMAYGRLADRKPLREVGLAVARRIRRLFLVNLVLAAVIAPVAWSFAAQPEWTSAVLKEYGAIRGLSLLELAVGVNEPWLLDILPAYMIFLATIPLLILAQKRRVLWLPLAVSGALWVAGQFFPSAKVADALMRVFPSRYVSFGWFELAAWQLVFVSGFVLGNLSRVGGLPAFLARPTWKTTAPFALLLVFLFVQRHAELPLPPLRLEPYLSVRALAPLRLLNFIALGMAIRGVWPHLRRPLGFRPLATIGKQSLPAFVFHILAIYACALLVPQTLPLALALPLFVLMTVSLYPAILVFNGWEKSWAQDREKSLAVSAAV